MPAIKRKRSAYRWGYEYDSDGNEVHRKHHVRTTRSLPRSFDDKQHTIPLKEFWKNFMPWKPFKSFSLQSDMSKVPPTPRGRSRTRATSKSRSKSRSKLMSISRARSTSVGSKAAGDKPSKNVRFVPTHETGYMGSFKKPKLVRRKRAEAYDKYGAVLKREKNGLVTSKHCLYVGHGTAVGQIVYQAWRAVYRSLMTLAGYDFKSWEDPFNIPLSVFSVNWTIGESAAPTQVNLSYGVSTTKTHYEVSTEIAAAVALQLTDGNPLDSITFNEIILYKDENGLPVGTQYALARINLTNYTVVIDDYSIMKVKNVSLAEGSSTNPDSDLTTNVAAQPLVGKSYQTATWSNGFQLTKDYDAAGVGILVPDPIAAQIIGTAETVGAADNTTNPYRKPMPGYAFGKVKTATARMNPGEVKVMARKWKARMSFNVLANRLFPQFNVLNNAGDLRPFGSAQMVALEREVCIGAASTLVDPIRLAYQIDQVLKIRGYSKKQKVLPITDTFEG